MTTIPIRTYLLSFAITPLSTASISGALQSENSFSSLLLLAALHYSWNTGHLREYETTYLVHKIKCLQVINDFINDTNRDPRRWRPHLSSIATLCLTDASTGNLDAAEAHLDGLTALLGGRETSKPRECTADEKERAEYAVLERYILVCITEIARMRYERDRTEQTSQGADVDLTKTDASLGAVMPLHKLEDRLSGFWLMPYFLATNELTCTDVDGAKHLNNLRFLTSAYGGRYPSTLPTGLTDCMTEDWGTSAAGMRSYFMQGMAAQNTKISSPAGLSGPPLFDNERNHQTSSPDVYSARYAMYWNTLSVTSGFYLYAVLNLGTSPGNVSIKGHPLLWIIRTLQREADTAFEKMLDDRNADIPDSEKRSPELFLWTLFMGSIIVAGLHHVAAAANNMESSMPGGETTFRALESWFAGRMRDWSDVTGVRAWAGDGGARDTLAAIVWPAQATTELLAQAIWEEAVGIKDRDE